MDKKDQITTPREIPLHQRRFEAKSEQSPKALNTLPNDNELQNREPNNSEARKLCEEMVGKYGANGAAHIPELQTLSERSASTACAALATQDAFDHLDKLYILVDQLLTLKEQNSKMQRKVRDIEHLKSLQEMHKQIEKEMQKAMNADCEEVLKDEATSMDLGEEYSYTEALLDSMLAAGRNASLKRSKRKSPSRSKIRQSIVRKPRSRSMGGEELESSQFPDDSRLEVPVILRRDSEAKTATNKSKISKWTRVKAAFKWEKAHNGVSNEPIAGTSGMSSSHANSVFTSTTPGSLSSVSSVEDLGNGEHNMQKHESARRSRSLDSSAVLNSGSGAGQQEDEVSSPSMGKLHKTPWGKMKDIIQTRKESVRKKQNRSSVKSISDGRNSENYSLSDGGGVSHSGSAEILGQSSSPRRKTSSQERSESSLQDISEIVKRRTPTLTITMPSSEELTKSQMSKSASQGSMDSPSAIRRELRKQKSLDLAKKQWKFNLDSSDPDTASSPVVNRRDSKWKKVKKAFLTSTSMSTPSSPSRHTSFFPEYESKSKHNDDGSMPKTERTPATKNSVRSTSDQDISEDSSSKGGTGIEEEIRKQYAALQIRLSREFTERAQAWGSGSQSPGPSSFLDDWNIDCGKIGPSTPGSSPVSDTRLSSNFSRKAQSTNRCPPPVLSHAQLSEDFRKKLEEWKRLKATNSVPAYTGEEADKSPKDHDERYNKLKKVVGSPKKEVLVQTGAGFFRFEGISRSFTRKLHEWEKSRGIAPEASTSALLKESLARPPRPAARANGRESRITNHHKNERMRLQRSQSEGSVREDPASMISATSASSLSLSKFNDQIEDNVPVSDGEACDLDSPRALGEGIESDSDGCPGALLVEVEDVEEETAAPLVACNPILIPQTPIYKYGQAQERHRACEINEGKLSPITRSTSVLPNSWQDQVSNIKESVTNILREEEIVQKLLQGMRNIADRCDDVLKQIDDLRGQTTKPSSSINDMEKRVNRLSKEKIILENSLKERLKNINELFPTLMKLINNFNSSCADCIDLKKFNSELYSKASTCFQQSSNRVKLINEGKLTGESILPDLNRLLEITREIKDLCDKSEVKTRSNSLGILYKINKGKYSNEPKEIIHIVENTSTQVDDQENDKKIESLQRQDSRDSKRRARENGNKSLSSSMKRKTRTKRLERDKSIHSNSDSEDESNSITVELPRRKKISRSRRTSETHVSGIQQKQNSLDKSNTDSAENIFVLKLKPSNPSSDKDQEEDIKQTVIMKKQSFDEKVDSQNSVKKQDSVEILLSSEQLSIDLPPEGIEIQAAENETSSTADIFVKTTRKIFSPVRKDSKGKTKAVIGLNVEDIASSIEKSRIERNSSIDQSQENLPDVIINKNRDPEEKPDEFKRPFPVYHSESLNCIRSHTSSPLFARKQSQLNNSSKTLTGSRNASEESIYHSRDGLPIRRGSTDKFFCKGSPILSRSSTLNVCGTASSLPPLPASPPSTRRDKPYGKDTSPSIRIMIQKYNKRLNEEGTEVKLQTGSNTPPWRSPRSQEKFPHDVHHILHHSPVRNNPFLNREVQKSASASQILLRKNSSQEREITSAKSFSNSKENMSDTNPEMTPPLPKKLLKGILKSSSAGSLKANSPLLLRRIYVENKKDSSRNGLKNDSIGYEMQSKTENNEDTSKIEDKPSKPKVQKEESNEKKDNFGKYSKKIPKELLKQAISMPNTPIGTCPSNPFDEIPQPLHSRALQLKKAKEQFLTSDSINTRNRHRDSDLVGNRLSQISYGSDTSYEGNFLLQHSGISSSFLTKSASVGMINEDRNRSDRDKGYESLPRNQSNLSDDVKSTSNKSGSRFGLASLASKFRKVRLRKPKGQATKEDRLNTISKLCRQSLIVNFQSEEPSMSSSSQHGGSQTDSSIVSAGRTGAAIGAGGSRIFDRNISKSDSSPGCSKKKDKSK